jgi:hypothetical protein
MTCFAVSWIVSVMGVQLSDALFVGFSINSFVSSDVLYFLVVTAMDLFLLW